MRADDLGFCEAINYGIHKTVEQKNITCVGLMPNAEAAEHGYNLIKEYDISLGQHTNICLGKPVSNPKYIPSLVDENGVFYRSKDINSRKFDTIDLKECEIEVEAQLKRFVEITGKYPDYFEGHAVFSEIFFQALRNVAKKYNLFFCNPMDPNWQKENNVFLPKMYKLDNNNCYDPEKYLEELTHNLLKNKNSILIFHPGYLDQYVLENSSFTKIRTLELDFLCSDYLKKWKKNNHVQFINFKELKLIKAT